MSAVRACFSDGGCVRTALVSVVAMSSRDLLWREAADSHCPRYNDCTWMQAQDTFVLSQGVVPEEGHVHRCVMRWNFSNESPRDQRPCGRENTY